MPIILSYQWICSTKLAAALAAPTPTASVTQMELATMATRAPWESTRILARERLKEHSTGKRLLTQPLLGLLLFVKEVHLT